jgi:hypothetical protein
VGADPLAGTNEVQVNPSPFPSNEGLPDVDERSRLSIVTSCQSPLLGQPPVVFAAAVPWKNAPTSTAVVPNVTKKRR